MQSLRDWFGVYECTDEELESARSARARFIKLVNRERISLGKRPIRRYAIRLDVVLIGFLGERWFRPLVIEMPCRARWCIDERIRLFLDAHPEASDRFLPRVGWTWQASFRADVVDGAPHALIWSAPHYQHAVCVPEWVVMVRDSFRPNQREAVIRFLLQHEDALSAVDAVARLNGARGVRGLVKEMMGAPASATGPSQLAVGAL